MVVYQAAFAGQSTIDLGDGLGNEPIVNEAEAIRTALNTVESWTRNAGCSRALICLSAAKSDSFRHRLYPPYKANRKSSKPTAYKAVRQALEVEFDTYIEPNLEADDLMGIAGTADAAQCVIVSRDKDMKTVPALVFNPSHDPRPRRILPGIAYQMWMNQTMCGDAVDNYPGIPKVGPKKAEEILLNPHRLTQAGKKWIKGEECTVWQSMVDYAAKAGMTEEDLIRMAQVSRILRTGDFDKEKRTVRLWRPDGYEEMKLDA